MISVVVPVYNVEAYLEECLDSILVQTYHDIEIILVDDGSSDRSGQICDEYASKDNRIKVIHKENGGLSSARNFGIDNSTGEYIAFVDSDDWIDNYMFESMLHEIEKSQRILVVNCQPIFVYEDGRTELRWNCPENKLFGANDVLRTFLSEESNHFIPTKLFRREAFEELRFVEGRNDEDTLFSYELGKFMQLNNFEMVELSCAPYYYRQRVGSICYDDKKPLRVDRLGNLDEIKKDLQSFNPELDCYVERLRVRTLEWFVYEIRHNEAWRRKYLTKYTKQIRRIDNALARQFLSPGRYRTFLISKYAPVWIERIAAHSYSLFRRLI